MGKESQERGDGSTLDLELLQLQQVSSVALRDNPEIAEHLYKQWLSLPETDKLGDFKPVLRDLLETHPGLEFLQATPVFQERYAETVIYRIFYYVNRSGNGHLTLRELKHGNLIVAMQHADEEKDINKVLRYFSYEQFYVIYCKFWEFDIDHDFLINKENLVRYGNHALIGLLTEFFQRFQETLPARLKEKWVMKILFTLYCQRKINHWFKCIDLDGNGILTRNEMQFFYEEQLHRMECMAQEPVLFEDILCQMIDMIGPENESYLTLSDLKGCKLSGNVLNILFNLNKFMAFETHDPFLIRQELEDSILTERDRFAHREYIRLSMEEDGEDASNESTFTKKLLSNGRFPRAQNRGSNRILFQRTWMQQLT